MISDAGMGESDLLRIVSEIRVRHQVPATVAAYLTSEGLQKVCAVGTRKWTTGKIDQPWGEWIG